VIAFSSGALPEIVEHGKTGYLVSNVREMAEAIGAVDDLNCEDCRSAARRRFSADMMWQRYDETYRRILSAKAVEYAHARTASATSWLVSW
jgi:glycosyltransferase involved in cell wall biosynthesis